MRTIGKLTENGYLSAGFVAIIVLEILLAVYIGVIHRTILYNKTKNTITITQNVIITRTHHPIPRNFDGGGEKKGNSNLIKLSLCRRERERAANFFHLPLSNQFFRR